jgi:hypothetical protein
MIPLEIFPTKSTSNTNYQYQNPISLAEFSINYSKFGSVPSGNKAKVNFVATNIFQPMMHVMIKASMLDIWP